jgi:tRNA nucleotidyltransferase (CCA-adding enzyme)
MNPSKDFFILSAIPEINLSNQNDPILSNIFILELKNKDPDVHYTINRDKLYSLGDRIKANGEREFSHENRFGNIVFEVYFEDNLKEYNLAVYSHKTKISPAYLRKGPRIKNKIHAEKFKKKNRNYIVKDGYLWAETQREFDKFFDFLKIFVKNKIPDNLEVVNLSNSFNCRTSSGKKAIYVLKNMVLPFFL